MKRIFAVVVVLLLAGIAGFAQKVSENDIPKGVLKAYFMKINDTIPTTWEKYESFYTARFTKDNLKGSMVFNEATEWIWTRWELPVNYIPKKIKEYLTSNYPKYKTISNIVEYKAGGEFYLVGIKLKKDEKVLRFSSKSEFVNVEPKTSPAAEKK